jgi:hypothetical protein
MFEQKISQQKIAKRAGGIEDTGAITAPVFCFPSDGFGALPIRRRCAPRRADRN